MKNVTQSSDMSGVNRDLCVITDGIHCIFLVPKESLAQRHTKRCCAKYNHLRTKKVQFIFYCIIVIFVLI